MTESNPEDEDDEFADSIDKDGASGGLVWDDKESDVLWQALADTRLITSADSMRDFLKAVDDAVSLSADDKLELARRIEAGRRASQVLTEIPEPAEEQRRDLMRICREGAQARDDLLKAHRRLVISIAKRYVGRGTAFLDLVQGGRSGAPMCGRQVRPQTGLQILHLRHLVDPASDNAHDDPVMFELRQQ